MNHTRTLIALGTLCLGVTVLPAEASGPAGGVITPEQAADIAVNTIEATEDGVLLRNPRYRVDFRADGVTFTPRRAPEWRWSLSGVIVGDSALNAVEMDRVVPVESEPRIIDYDRSAIIERYVAHGGTVNEYIGDSLMAIFGAPIDYGNHARRAVQAAQDILRRVAERNETLKTSELYYEVRISINSGKVVVGSVGPSQRLKYAVIGDTVNIAARLEKFAAPGSTVIGANTYDALGGEIPCQDLGEIKLKGIN